MMEDKEPSSVGVAKGSPVTNVDGEKTEQAESGVALCLSGGGYRAMLFHAGAVLRLNEDGLLKRLERVSSVPAVRSPQVCWGLHGPDFSSIR